MLKFDKTYIIDKYPTLLNKLLRLLLSTSAENINFHDLFRNFPKEDNLLTLVIFKFYSSWHIHKCTKKTFMPSSVFWQIIEDNLAIIEFYNDNKTIIRVVEDVIDNFHDKDLEACFLLPENIDETNLYTAANYRLYRLVIINFILQEFLKSHNSNNNIVSYQYSKPNKGFLLTESVLSALDLTSSARLLMAHYISIDLIIYNPYKFNELLDSSSEEITYEDELDIFIFSLEKDEFIKDVLYILKQVTSATNNYDNPFSKIDIKQNCLHFPSNHKTEYESTNLKYKLRLI